MESRYPIRSETLITADEFIRMKGDESSREELVRGRIVREPLPGGMHGGTDWKIVRALSQFVPSRVPGEILINTGFILARNPDTVRGPDVSFVAAHRLPNGLPDGSIPFAPDLAIETVSKWNRPRELAEKAHEYMEAGTRLVWIVDPRTRTVTVYRPGRDPVQLRAADALDGEDVIPGLSLPVESLFPPGPPP